MITFDPMIIAFTGMTAFISEYLDSSLGMGYGTALTPVLIMAGFDPLKVIPAVLISQFVTDVVTCFFHHKCANVDFRMCAQDLKIAVCLGAVSSLGVIGAVIIAVRIPQWLLSLYIGVLVFMMGVLILVTVNRVIVLSWRKILGISFLAAFNKGLSGGGYGPLVMGGQILSGVHPKNAVGITAFAEAVTCLAGFCAYFALGKTVDWQLTGLLLIFAIPAVPLAAFTVNRVPARRLKIFVGLFIALLGLVAIVRISAGM